MILPLLPPIVTLILVLFTRKIWSALITGIVLGIFIINHFDPIQSLLYFVKESYSLISTPSKLLVISYVQLFGMLTQLLALSQGARELALRAKHSVMQVHFAALAMGVLLFFDDYFSCLAVGVAFVRSFDLLKIPRYRLAFLIDSTASPICLLAPFSTWVAFITGLIDCDLKFYYRTIPYNIYCWGIILVAAYYCWQSKKIRFEEANLEIEELQTNSCATHSIKMFLLPLTSLFIFLIFGVLFIKMLPLAIGLSVFLSVLVALYLGHRELNLTWPQLRHQCNLGRKQITGTLIILILSCFFGIVIKDLGVGPIISSLVKVHIASYFVPALLFSISSLISFSTGTAYGTYSLMLPIAMALGGSPLLVASVLGGGVFGDHASPLSDTTVLSVDKYDHLISII